MNPALPPPVGRLLDEMEHLADRAGLSFPKVVALMSENGPRVHKADVTRWRDGKSLPRAEDTRRWASACGRPADLLDALHSEAAPAFRTWKENSDGRRRASSAGSAPPTGGPGHRGARYRWRAAVIISVAGVLTGAGTLMWINLTGGAPSPPAFTAETCTWLQQPLPSIVWTPGASSRREVPLMYKVASGPGSTDVAVEAGGSVLQPFVATAPRVDQVAAIIGIDAQRADPRADHPVRFEILEPGRDGNLPRVVGAGRATVTPENANKDVSAAVGVPVTPGGLYVLRVVNEADTDPIGVYMNRPHGRDRTVVYAADVCVIGPIVPFTTDGWVLAGFVSATT